MGICTLLILMGSAAYLCAQDTSFQTQSREVLVPVTVMDHKGGFVDGLSAADFELLDDGVPRRIASMDTFDSGLAPISMIIAVQSAGISAPALDRIRHIGSMIVPLITGERGAAAVLTFDTELHLIQDFTDDNAAVANALDSIKPAGGTTARMLDAAADAIRRLAARKTSRRVLLLISESRDRGSKAHLAEVMREAERFNVAIYAASYSAYATTFLSKPQDVPQDSGGVALNPDNSVPPSAGAGGVDGGMSILPLLFELARLGKTNTVRALAAATGGTVESFTRERALEAIIEHLGTELHSQYVLGFVPQTSAPGFHRLEVRLVNQTSSGTALHVRARPGYEMVSSDPGVGHGAVH
jgi:VWFA-related protein